jgi:TPR repeat protein
LRIQFLKSLFPCGSAAALTVLILGLATNVTAESSGNDRLDTELLLQQANKGDVSAQRQLGFIYEKSGSDQDSTEAVKWFRKASENGDSIARVKLGVALLAGVSVEKDIDEAIKWFRLVADQGDESAPVAMQNLGQLYYYGQDVVKNLPEALRWYRRAADQGWVTSQIELGKLYYNGQGVEQDFDEARNWFRQAAETGDPRGQYYMGLFFYLAGTNQNTTEAAKWFRRSANQGNVEAQSLLGASLLSGQGVDKDRAQAKEWFLKSAEGGSFRSQTALGAIFYEDGDLITALKWYALSANKGDSISQKKLGDIYRFGGPALDTDIKRAAEWYERAANQGNARAQSALGQIYQWGEGGADQDLEKALSWYRKAADQKDIRGQFGMAEIMQSRDRHDEAIGLFKVVASRTDISGLFMMGEAAYELGKYSEKRNDNNEAVKWYRVGAEQNHGPSLWKVGVFLDEAGDVSEAKKVLQRGWIAQDISAFLHLAWMDLRVHVSPFPEKTGWTQAVSAADRNFSKIFHKWKSQVLRGVGATTEPEAPESGYGIQEIAEYLGRFPSQDMKALSLYVLAAERGQIRSQLRLAREFLLGNNIAPDHEKGVYWAREAVDDGSSNAKVLLGMAHWKGIGVHADAFESIRWFTSAAEQGDICGQYNLGHIFENSSPKYRDLSKAFALYELASKSLPAALLKLIEFHKSGNGVTKDLDKALSLARKGLRQGGMLDIGKSTCEGSSISEISSNSRTLSIEHYLLTSSDFNPVIDNWRSELSAEIADIEKMLERERSRDFAALKNLGNYHALIIGNNDYKYIDPLSTAVSDAEAIDAVLRDQYGYKTELLKNASRSEILKALNSYRRTLGQADNFLLFYAGHGIMDPDTGVGYWQPIDAEFADDSNWIPSERITNVLTGMLANNVMLIVDSCYSGAILPVFRATGAPALSKETSGQIFNRLHSKKSRIALTSGGLEPVVDSIGGSPNSVFTGEVVKYLRQNSTVLTATDLHQVIRDRVIPLTSGVSNQTPELRRILAAGDDAGGNFLFVPAPPTSRKNLFNPFVP